jgi:regulator of protease activity HflC (stomatin/prohibitin superfamily)
MSTNINDYFNKNNNKQNNNKNDNSNNNSNKNWGQPPQFDPSFFNNLGKKAYLLYIAIFIIVMLIISKPFIIINAGEVGIKVTTGKYDPMPLNPGFHFLIPFVQKIIIVDTRVRIINYVNNDTIPVRGNGVKTRAPIGVLDQRGLPVSIELTVQYKLRPLNAPQTIATWGLGWEDKIINPVVRDIVRTVVGSLTAEELPRKRNEIAQAIEIEFRKNIDNIKNQPVILESVQLRNIGLPNKIKEQIERVQIAKQETERTRYEVEKAKQTAEKRAALATGRAQAEKIQAQGVADAITIKAKAQSKANLLIGKSLSKNVLALKQLEVQGKFNDALRTNKDAKIFLTPGGSVPNIWVDMKNPQKRTSTSR